MLDADNPTDLVSDFIVDAGPEMGFQLVGEVQVLLAGTRTSQALGEFVRSLGSRYDPGLGGVDVEAWLTDVAAAAIRALLDRAE